MVPDVAPAKPPVTAVLDTEKAIKPDSKVSAGILKSGSMEGPTYITNQHAKRNDKTKDLIKHATESVTSEAGEGSLATPEVTLPTKHVVTTVSDAENVAEPNSNV